MRVLRHLSPLHPLVFLLLRYETPVQLVSAFQQRGGREAAVWRSDGRGAPALRRPAATAAGWGGGGAIAGCRPAVGAPQAKAREEAAELHAVRGLQHPAQLGRAGADPLQRQVAPEEAEAAQQREGGGGSEQRR